MTEQTFWPDRDKLKDPGGRYLTQSLFLEHKYDTTYAMYSLSDQDKEYEGKIYPSLRRLYLESMDPTEYTFATTYLSNWEQWQRICANQALLTHIEEWREELEVKVRAQAVKRILNLGIDNFTAAKWAADGHWNVKRGRPSKAEQEREKKLRERALEEQENDSSRVVDFIRRRKE